MVATGYSGPIDSLQTLEEVRRFITTLGGHVANVDTFLKTDLDNNGLADLIVKGDPLTIVMNSNSAGDKLHYVYPPGFASEYLLMGVDSSGGQQQLLLKTSKKKKYLHYSQKRIPENNKDTALREAQPIDTLVYRFNGFIEYNAAPPRYKIKSVRLATTTCLGTCPEYNLVVNSDRTADYNAGYYTGKSGHFTGIIDERSFNELMQLIDYIHVQSLSENYAIEATDYPTAILKVIFEDGQEKLIQDYGMRGTHGLRALYHFIDKLRSSQEWIWDRKIK
ncbi:hypothetical protein LX66_4397 [Chitinophaga japonensis]|uniref:DUF6438 domain-containing protein n=2 Tax=Chitinophaga japonensis TaxID=104662 RepID=A0A562SS10_CHIJA|nr:hypothetical protein LX66_4397 [Chitinophaga japonensis]